MKVPKGRKLHYAPPFLFLFNFISSQIGRVAAFKHRLMSASQVHRERRFVQPRLNEILLLVHPRPGTTGEVHHPTLLGLRLGFRVRVRVRVNVRVRGSEY